MSELQDAAPCVRGTADDPVTPSSACDVVQRAVDALEAWQASQKNVGEESLTDWLLYSLAAQLKGFGYEKFTKPREARVTGADWEWWMLSKRVNFAMLIQAKRLDEKSRQSRVFSYENQHGMQIKKLISHAHMRKLPPYYMLYATRKLGALAHCTNGVHTSAAGAYLSSAESILTNVVMVAPSSSNWLKGTPQLVPLSCLFCCGQSNSSVAASTLPVRMPSLFFGTSDQFTEGGREVPPYVQAILNREGGETLFRDTVADPKVAGVVVCDLDAISGR